MTLSEVSDGGLQIDLEARDFVLGFEKHAPLVDLDWLQRYFMNSYEYAGANAKEVISSVEHALQGQERFFLPVRPISRLRIRFPCLFSLLTSDGTNGILPRPVASFSSRIQSSTSQATCCATLSTMGECAVGSPGENWFPFLLI
jgi:hypothetical protein